MTTFLHIDLKKLQHQIKLNCMYLYISKILMKMTKKKVDGLLLAESARIKENIESMSSLRFDEISVLFLLTKR